MWVTLYRWDRESTAPTCLAPLWWSHSRARRMKFPPSWHHVDPSRGGESLQTYPCPCLWILQIPPFLLQQPGASEIQLFLTPLIWVPIFFQEPSWSILISECKAGIMDGRISLRMMSRKSSRETLKIVCDPNTLWLILAGTQGDGVKYCNGHEMEGKRSGVGNIQPICPHP